MKRIAYFISAHGFGHAARSCAIMSEMARCDPQLTFEIFSNAPEWFFEDSLRVSYTLHPVLTDIGVVQASPLSEDIPATLAKLNEYYPLDPKLVFEVSDTIRDLDCSLIISDISPLGIAAAQLTGLPVVLVENFTWDWIYAGYLKEHPSFAQPIQYLKSLYDLVPYRIQTEPLCDPRPASVMNCPPISRLPRTSRAEIRKQLNIPNANRVILVSMGGIPENYGFLSSLPRINGVSYVVLGNNPSADRSENLILLPHHSTFYHPDLIYAADVIISKVGYSTIAEAFHAGIPFGYVTRPGFRESAILEDFMQKNMACVEIPHQSFLSGSWFDAISELLSFQPHNATTINGAILAAEFLMTLL